MHLLLSVLKADLERVLEAADGAGVLDEDEDDLQRALAISRHEIDMEDEEADLRRAIQLSMQGMSIWGVLQSSLENWFKLFLAFQKIIVLLEVL